MSQSLIRSLFESRLASWAATQSLQVAWENVPFSPPSGTYLRAFLLPASTGSDDLLGAHRAYRGVFQVSVVAQRDTSPVPAEQVAEAIAAEFPNNLRLTSGSFAVQLITPMSLARAIIDDTRYIIPVSGQYRADTI